MCTVIVAVEPTPGLALVLAANRDERLDRAASGPAVRLMGDTRAGGALLCPRDEVAGGTWWALAPSGLFVALTNRAGPSDPTRVSRGKLVAEAALAGDVTGALAVARAHGPGHFNGYHLLASEVRDGRARVGVIVDDGERIKAPPVPSGAVSVVAERSWGAARDARTPRVHGALADLEDRGDASPAAWVAALVEVLRMRGEGVEDAVDVRLDALGYGSRSSSLLLVGDDGAVALAHAPGPPGAPFVSLRPQVDALMGAPAGVSGVSGGRGRGPTRVEAWLSTGLEEAGAI